MIILCSMLFVVALYCFIENTTLGHCVIWIFVVFIQVTGIYIYIYIFFFFSFVVHVELFTNGHFLPLR